MNDAERIRQHHGGPHLEGRPPQGPYWKRMHHSPFFWVALVAMLLAMGVMVGTIALSIIVPIYQLTTSY